MKTAFAVTFAAGLVLSCSSRPPAASGPARPKADKTGGGNTGAAARRPGAPGAVPSTDCTVGPCMYHPGAGTYHRCLNAGAGRCFQYGPACEPEDRCMYDAGTGSHRTCEDSREGACIKHGSVCQPRGLCMIDPTDGIYRTCQSSDPGRCRQYGDTCSPT